MEDYKKRVKEYQKLLKAIKKDEIILDYVDEKYNYYSLMIKKEGQNINENDTRRKM